MVNGDWGRDMDDNTKCTTAKYVFMCPPSPFPHERVQKTDRGTQLWTQEKKSCEPTRAKGLKQKGESIDFLLF